MGVSGDWFRTIIIRKKSKQDRSKQTEEKSSNGKGSKSSSGGRIRNLSPDPDVAATRIQTAFRAYMARKALRRLKGIVRCRNVMKEISIENQPSVALNHIHFWTKIQSEIKARRMYMVTQGRIQQKKLENKLKLEAKLHDLEVEWCGGSETMEEILQRIQQREEAAVKRERAMAYAFSHQWRANSGQYFGHAYYDLGKESWGWSWKERWVAVRPWETRVQLKKSANNLKKSQSKHADKAEKGITNSAMKIILTVKPSLSNEKGLTQARRLSDPAGEKQAS
ncbi:hypothetical protein M9H77_21770 [Catharanthus roseus]|uniref:Uncharacterized protein n=1 Tax=Catharanthus roseus TaxID=4058 RepID=A0ACC0AR33_CATRO|nr:hypothetical protein M9H77_21770 [Catharanthus roseus]